MVIISSVAVFVCYEVSISFMVGKFVGWLTYLPALPNWVSASQNSIRGSFQYNVHYIARSYFSNSLVFNMYEVPITLNADNSISRPPF